ncbi:MAG: FixH family protein [Bacteroidota bacterium]
MTKSMLAFPNKAAAVLSLVLLTACAPDITETDFYQRHPDPSELEPPEAMTIAESTADGFTLTLAAREALHAGYNRVLVKVVEGEAVVPFATVQLRATLGDRTAPVDRASVGEPDEDGFVEAGVYFLQPKGEAQTWALELAVAAEGRTVQTTFEVAVEDALWMQALDQDEPLYLSWVQPSRPVTGDDAYILALHRPTDTGFEAVTDAALDLYPYMDMGGGDGHSTPFAAPTHQAEGIYEGRVNFIMAGGWDMTVYVQRGSDRAEVLFDDFIVY